jgi:hypothetical protein
LVLGRRVEESWVVGGEGAVALFGEGDAEGGGEAAALPVQHYGAVEHVPAELERRADGGRRSV